MRSRRQSACVLLVLIVVGLSAAEVSAYRSSYTTSQSPYTHRLHAGERVKRWRTPQRWGPDWMVFINAYVRGRHVPDRTEGCRTEWTGHGVAIQARVCGKGAVPIRLRYVSYEGPRPITIRYYARRVSP